MSTLSPPSLAPGWSRHFRLAQIDIAESIMGWRLWSMMALNDINQRYRRSLLGPFWLTLSTGLLIAALGFVYSFLFKIPLHEYMPYLTIGQIFWTFIGGILIDSGSAFTSADSFLKQVRLPKLALVLRMMLRHLMVLAHNLVILLVVWLIFMPQLDWAMLLVFPGLLLMLLCGLGCATVLATVCTRFRDMPQIVNSLMQLAYFVTPIMWHADQLPEDLRWLMLLNPFAVFIELVRAPLLGIAPSPASWATAGCTTIIALTISFVFFARFRSRITYWL